MKNIWQKLIEWSGCVLAILGLSGGPAAFGETVTVTDEVSITIPDGDVAGTLVRMNVSGIPEGQGIRDLNVVLSVDGTVGFNGDLYAYLTKADNTAFSVLLNRPGRTQTNVFGSAGAGLDRLVFDDEATNGDIRFYEDVVGASAIFGLPWTGSWQPDGRLIDPALVTGSEPRAAMLDQFDGVSPNGEWLLFLADVSPGGLLTLTHWTLEFDVDAPVTSFSGVASDGLVAGGTVYFDANLNGVRDAGEPWVLTDGQGDYQLNVLPGPFDQNGDGVLSAAEGVLVISGGTDIATGLPLEISFRAPLGAQVIHPLTTLIAQLLIRDPNLSAADAETRVETALGLDPALAARVDLLSFDMYAEAAQGNPDAVVLVNAVAQIQDTVVQVGDFVSGVNGVARLPVIELAFEQLVNDLIAGKNLELTSLARVRELVDAVDATLWNGLNENQKDVAAEIITANNAFKQSVADGAESVAERVSKLAQTQVQVQSEIAGDLRLAGTGQLSLQDALVKNTFANLASSINGGPVGDVLGNLSAVGSFSFDQLGYEATEAGKALHPITVIREGGNAGTVQLLVTPSRGTADDTDFVDQAIEVGFAPLEIRKTLDVAALIRNDTVVEGSEFMGLSLGLRAGHPQGASLGSQSTAQLSIVDDDTPGTISFGPGPFVIRENGEVVIPITLVRSEGSDGFLPVVVQVEAVAGGATIGTDLVGGSFLVTFEDGNLNQTLDAIIIDDIRLEPDEDVTLRLSLAPQAPATAALGARSTATLTIQNDDFNNPTVISQITDQRSFEDQAIVNLPFTITDLEHDTSQIVVTAASSNLNLVPLSGLSLGGQGDDRTISIFPNREAHGTTKITISANDGFDTTTMSFDLTVDEVNDPVVITSLPDIEVQSGTGILLSEFKYVDVDTIPANIRVSFEALTPDVLPLSSITSVADGFFRFIQITPPISGSGKADFAIHVSDELSVTTGFFSVTIVGDANPVVPVVPPVALRLGTIADLEMNEDGSVKVPIDLTVEGSPEGALSFSLLGDNDALLLAETATIEEEGGVYSMLLQPIGNAHGTVNLVLSVSVDDKRASQSFRLTVQPVDDPPQVELAESLTLKEDEEGQITLTVTDLDSSASELRVELLDSGNPVMLPEGSVLIEQDGASFPIQVQPRSNVFGTATVQLRVFDQTNSLDVAFDLSVNAVDDPPTISMDPLIEILEGESAVLAIGIDDVDTALDRLELVVRSLDEALLPSGGLALQGEGGARQLRVVPAANAFSEAGIEIEVSDGVTATKQVLSVRVIKLDDAPRLSPLPPLVMGEDEVSFLDLVSSDSDTPRDQLVFTASATNETLFPAGSLSVVRAAGLDQLRLQPAADRHGESEVILSLSDGVNTVQQSFTVIVEGVNDAPRIAGLEAITLPQGGQATVSFEVSDPDDDLDRIFVALATLNPELIDLQGVQVVGTGIAREFIVKGVEGRSGVGEVIVGVSDGDLVATQRLEVTITPLPGAEPEASQMSIGFLNGSLQISWDPPGTLFSSDSVEGPFERVPGAISPLVVDPVEAQRYFRVVSP